ncbi:MAG: 3-phytase [Sulfurimonas sp.]|nr:MAG: 3-phytase [Sulfurimonas sp.]
MKRYVFFALLGMLVLSGCSYSYTENDSVINVLADSETEIMNHDGDVADDPAIWLHPHDREKSLIIGTNKKGGGLDVYDLSGKRIQSLKDGKFNNVDLRYGMQVGGKKVDIVAATNRTNDSLALYGVDPQSRLLYPIAARTISTLDESYGTCMYHNQKNDTFYVFVNSKSGEYREYELFESNAKVDAKLVRTFFVGSQPEGCVADDETDMLYVGEEDVGIWRFGALPQSGDMRVLIDAVKGGHIKDDVEGLALYTLADGGGYLVASSQGNNSYTLYNRKSGAYIGAFRIVDGVIDGTNDTDGIEVTSQALGLQYPYGMMIVQDGTDAPSGKQNFKILRMEKVLDSLHLAY